MTITKRWIITGASFGAGMAVILTLILGGLLWYANKPKPPRPWNAKAVTAVYESVDTEGQENTLVFYYVLHNNTDFDYKIPGKSKVQLMAKLGEQKDLAGTEANQWLKFDSPLFLPAKQRLRFAIHLNYPCDRKKKAEPTQNERDKHKKEVSAFLKEKASNLSGFVIFDEANRYQIDFPRDW